MFRLIIILLITIFIAFENYASENKIIVASTTSTYDSGLLTYLNKEFKKKYNIDAQVISLGTGQAIRTAMDGNVEVLLVHHRESEIKFIKDGYGLKRYNLMYNDYIIVGPKNDDKQCYNLESKLLEIINNNFIFISRGDDSGTHKKELELWKSINININDISHSKYLKVGQGMGYTLLITNEKSAYTLSDRSTWVTFKKKENLKIICESQPPLFNQYGLILINPKINNQLNYTSAKIYIDWLLSEEGKILINNFSKKGKQLFFYNYK